MSVHAWTRVLRTCLTHGRHHRHGSLYTAQGELVLKLLPDACCTALLAARYELMSHALVRVDGAYFAFAHLNLFSRLHMGSEKTQIQSLFSPPFLEVRGLEAEQQQNSN